MEDSDVKFSHFRMRLPGSSTPESGGGATIAYVQKGDLLLAAAAYCNPRDNFCYATGRLKAKARLTYLYDHPDRENGNQYFAIDIRGGDVAASVRYLRDFFIKDLGYTPRYVTQEEAPAATPA